MTTTFTSKKGGNKVYAYKCLTKTKKGNINCKCKDIPATAIESFVINLVRQIGSSDALFNSVFEQFQQNDDSQRKIHEERLSELRRNLTEVKIQSSRLINAITQDAEIGNLAAIKEKLSELEIKRGNVEKEIKITEDNIFEIKKDLTISKQETKELFQSVPELLKDIDRDTQHKLIDFIINEIRWYLITGEKAGEIEIFFRGNGHIKKKWVNNVNPLELGSRFCLDWLREQDSNLQPFG
jgi:site-specific DNA recombinase